MSDRADILAIVGLNKSQFNDAGEDVTVRDEAEDTEARVFRRGGKVVYRAGAALKWYDQEEDLPPNDN